MGKSKFKKLASSLLALLLSAITIFSSTVGAFAWSVDGTGSGTGGGGHGGGRGYGIPGEFATTGRMPLAGARFSVYNKYSGETISTIDVFRQTPGGANYIAAEKFSMKLNKIQLKKAYKNTVFSTTSSQANCFQASAVTSEFPIYADEMREWEEDYQNFNGILLAMGVGRDVTELLSGDVILIEPLYPLKAHNVMFALTPTEIAIMGINEYGDENSTGPSSSNGGTWGWISHYTNGYYPRAMYLDSTTLPDELPVGWNIANGGKVTNSNHASFKDIINSGFGIHIAYQNDTPKWEPPQVEKYTFTIIERLLDENGNFVKEQSRKTEEYVNSISGNGMYLPLSHTFSVFTVAGTKTGEYNINGTKYCFDSAILEETSSNNSGPRKTNISSFYYTYTISGTSELVINYRATNNRVTHSYTESELPAPFNYGALVYDGEVYHSDIQGWRYLSKVSGKNEYNNSIDADGDGVADNNGSDMQSTRTFSTFLFTAKDSVQAPEILHDVYGADGQKADYYFKSANVYKYNSDYASIMEDPNLGLNSSGTLASLPFELQKRTTDREFSFTMLEGNSYDVFLEYAKITDEYLVKFDANGGTGSMADIVAHPNEAVQLTENAFTKEGYTFQYWYLYDNDTKKWYGYNKAMNLGWYSDSELIKDAFGNPYRAAVKDKESITTSKRYGSITCYAQWKAKEVTFEYEGNGGIGEMERTVVPVNSENGMFSVSPNEFYYAGHQFLYWEACDIDSGAILGRHLDGGNWKTGWYASECYDDPQSYQKIELKDGDALYKDELPVTLADHTVVLTAHWQTDFEVQYYDSEGNALLLGSNFPGASKQLFGAVVGADEAATNDLPNVLRENILKNGTAWVLSDGTKLSDSQTPQVYYNAKPTVSTQESLNAFMDANGIAYNKLLNNARSLTINVTNLADFDERGNNTKQMFENCYVHIKGTTTKNSATLDMYFKVNPQNTGNKAVLNLTFPYGTYDFEVVNATTGSVFAGGKTNFKVVAGFTNVDLSVCFDTDFYDVVTNKNDANYGQIRYALDNFVLPNEFDGSQTLSYDVINRSRLPQESTSTYNAASFSAAAQTDGTFTLVLQPKLDYFPDDIALTGNKAGYKFHIFSVEGNEAIDFYVTTDSEGKVTVPNLPRNRTYYIEPYGNPVYLQCPTSTVYLSGDTSSEAASVKEVVRYDFRLNGSYEYFENEGTGKFYLTGDSYLSGYDIMGNQSAIPSWLSDAEELNKDFSTAGVGNVRHEDYNLKAVIGYTQLGTNNFANNPNIATSFCTFHYNREDGISLPDDARMSDFTRIDDGSEEKGVYRSKVYKKDLSEYLVNVTGTRLDNYGGYYYIIDEIENTIKVVMKTAEEEYPYSVHYDANGGEGTMESVLDIPLGETISLSPNAFTKENYKFLGWYAQDDLTGNWAVMNAGAVRYLDEDTISTLGFEKYLFPDQSQFSSNTKNGSYTMFAQWEPAPYYVSYDGNGGTLLPANSGVQTQEIKVRFDERYSVLNNLYEKEMSDFAFWALRKTEGAVDYYLGYDASGVLGWYTSPKTMYQVQPNDEILEGIVLNDGTTDFTLGPVESRFTFVAQWNTKFTVNFIDSSGNPAFTSWNNYVFMQGAYTDNGAKNNAYEGSKQASTDYLRDYSHYTPYYGKTQNATIRLATTKSGSYAGYMNVIPFAYNNNTGVSAVSSRMCKKCFPSYPKVNVDAESGEYICSKCGNVVPPEYNSVNKFNRDMQAFDGVNSWYAYKAVIKSPTQIDIVLYTKPEVVPNYQIHYNKNSDTAVGSMSSDLIYVETEDFVTTPTLKANTFTNENHFFKSWYLHDDDTDQWYGYYDGTLGWYPSALVFNNYKAEYSVASVLQIDKSNGVLQYNGSNVTLPISSRFKFYAVSDQETLSLSKIDGSVTVYAQWKQIPKKFTVEFLDAYGNPAFTTWNSAVRYEYNSTSGLETATGALEKHFADSLIDFGNDSFDGYLMLASTPDGVLNLDTTGVEKLYFHYNYLNGVSVADGQVYDTVLPLSGNSKWNYYKISVNEETDTITVTLLEQYTVRYDGNGGTGTMPVDGVSLGNQYTVRDNAFTKNGSDFAGYWFAKKMVGGKQLWYGYDKDKVLGWYQTPSSCYKFAEQSVFGGSSELGEIAEKGETVYMVAQWNTPFTVRFVDEDGNPAFPDNINSGVQYWTESASWNRTQTKKVEQSYFDTYNMDEKTRGITLFLAKNTGINYLSGAAYRDEFYLLYNRNIGVMERNTQEYDTRLKLKNNELWNYYSISVPSLYEVVVTLYDVHYDIHYNANGGEGTMASQKAWPNVDKQLTANQFTKNMSTFDCWYMKDDDTGLWYGYSTAGDTSTLGWYKKPAEYFRVEDASTINLPKEEGSVTLYAQWFTDFVVRFVDENGNPAFEDDFSNGLRAVLKDGTGKYLTTTKATQSYFTEQGLIGNIYENTYGIKLFLASKPNMSYLTGEKYRDFFRFAYNKNVGVTKDSASSYDTLIKLTNNTVWNYYKISIPNPNEVVVTLYDINYKIEYKGNGATSGSMTATTGYENKDVTLAENAYNRNQFAFRGWYLFDTDENTWYGTKNGVLGWYPVSEVLTGYTDEFKSANITRVTEQNVSFFGTFGEKALTFDTAFVPYKAKDAETFNFTKLQGVINAYALWAAQFTVHYVNPDGTPAFDNWNNHVTYQKGESSYWLPLNTNAETTYYASDIYNLDDFATGKTYTNRAILLNKQTDENTANGYQEFYFDYNSNTGVSEAARNVYDTRVYFNVGGASPFENNQWDAYSVSIPDAHNVVITLYDLSYTVNYDANGGVGTMASHKVHPNTAVALHKNTFTKDLFGYRYWHLKDDDTGLWYGYNASNVLGWYNESEIVSYKAVKDEETLNLSKEEGSVTLYAQWAAEFEIEFQNPDGTPAFTNWKTFATYDTKNTKVIRTDVSTSPVTTYYAPSIIQDETFKSNELYAARIGLHRFVDTVAHPEVQYIHGLGYSADGGLDVTNSNLFNVVRAFGGAITFEGYNWNAYKLTLVNNHKAVVTLYDLSYTIQFDANGGTGYMEPQYGRYGVDVKLRKNTFERAGYDYLNWRLYDNDTGRWYGYNNAGAYGWYPKATCDTYGYVEVPDEQTINLLKLQGTITAYAQWVQNPVEFRVHFIDGNGNEAFSSWNSAVRYEKTTTSGLVQSNQPTTEYYPSSVGELSYSTYEAYVSLANHATDSIDLTNASSMIQVKFNYNFATGVSESPNQAYNQILKFKDNEKWMSYSVRINPDTDDIYITLVEWPPRELDVEYYQPNANYVAGTSIIATFKVTNDTMYAYNPDEGNATMNVKMYSGTHLAELGTLSGKLIADLTKDFVIPPDKSQNVYFKIPIPKYSEASNITFIVTLSYNGEILKEYRILTNCSDGWAPVVNPNGYTTQIVSPSKDLIAKYGYSTVIPNGYQNQDANDVPKKKVPNVGTWDEYIYIGEGVYQKVTYYSLLRVDRGMTEPNVNCPVWWKDKKRNAESGKTDFYNLMRSGYGIDVYYSSAFYKSDTVAEMTGGIPCTNTDAFVPAQLSKIYYPENNYADIVVPLQFFDQSVQDANTSYSAEFDTAPVSFLMSRGTDGWIKKDEITDAQFDVATRSFFYRLNHFTPMWAKDGDYAVQPVVTNAWTPAGMLCASNVLDTTRIEGSIYSDWRWVSGKVD